MYQMNKQRQAHAEPEHDGEPNPGQGGQHPHSVHIHHAGPGSPHPGNPHHVHIHHADGSHEHSDHGSFDEAMDHANSVTGGLGGDEQKPEPEIGAEGQAGNAY